MDILELKFKMPLDIYKNREMLKNEVGEDVAEDILYPEEYGLFGFSKATTYEADGFFCLEAKSGIYDISDNYYNDLHLIFPFCEEFSCVYRDEYREYGKLMKRDGVVCEESKEFLSDISTEALLKELKARGVKVTDRNKDKEI